MSSATPLGLEVAGRVLLGAVLVCLLACTPKPAPTVSKTPTPTPTPAAPTVPPPEANRDKLEKLTTRLNQFSTALYLDLAERETGNLAISPLGSFLLLQLLYEGSSGTTHRELEPILGRSEAGMPEVARLVWEINRVPSIAIAHKIFADTGIEVLDSFLKRIDPVLAEPVETLPFGTAPEDSKARVNAWISEQTGGLLNGALPVVPQNTLCVLVSSLYFNGEWDKKFPKDETKAKEFRMGDGSKMKVPMMRLKDTISTLSFEGGRAVLLPYKHRANMVFFLPDEGVSPDSVWSKVDPTHLEDYLDQELAEVTVELPRFELRSPTLEISGSWKRLGLKETVTHPDLSRMLAPPLEADLMVFHQAFVKVDEVGTKVAVATVPGPRFSPLPPKPVRRETIRFDRPFAFLLYDFPTGAVFMMGRVERPEEWSR